jgi:hypothetical protein
MSTDDRAEDCLNVDRRCWAPIACAAFGYCRRRNDGLGTPGEAVREQNFARGSGFAAELGVVMIQFYGQEALRVASFLPGEPKPSDIGIEPNYATWCKLPSESRAAFLEHCTNAEADGWKRITIEEIKRL